MPRPSLRTRSLKRHQHRLPSGGGKITHYDKSRVGTPRCLNCGRIISGVPIVTASELGRLPSSKKHPNRAFGGQLCHLCLQQMLKEAARSTTVT